MLISHDSVSSPINVADRVIVMYCGRVVETAEIDDLFDRPAHPYTEGLLNSIPQPLDRAGQALPDPGRAAGSDGTRARLRLLSPLPEADGDLSGQSPPLFQVSETQQAACFALPAARA